MKKTKKITKKTTKKAAPQTESELLERLRKMIDSANPEENKKDKFAELMDANEKLKKIMFKAADELGIEVVGIMNTVKKGTNTRNEKTIMSNEPTESFANITNAFAEDQGAASTDLLLHTLQKWLFDDGAKALKLFISRLHALDRTEELETLKKVVGGEMKIVDDDGMPDELKEILSKVGGKAFKLPDGTEGFSGSANSKAELIEMLKKLL